VDRFSPGHQARRWRASGAILPDFRLRSGMTPFPVAQSGICHAAPFRAANTQAWRTGRHRLRQSSPPGRVRSKLSRCGPACREPASPPGTWPAHRHRPEAAPAHPIAATAPCMKGNDIAVTGHIAAAQHAPVELKDFTPPRPFQRHDMQLAIPHPGLGAKLHAPA
jgi:hypothetical protein